MTHEEFTKLTDKEAEAYLLAELKSIASAEAFANKELEDAVGVLLPNIAEQMLGVLTSSTGGSMPVPLPEDIKKRAVELCDKYGYLAVFEPGTWMKTDDGKRLVYVHDREGRPLWLPLDS